MTTVFVVRHAQSAANLSAVLSSASPGAELTPLGHEQAEEAGGLLVGQQVVRVVSSPLLRAETTAGHIGSAVGAPVEIDDDLREFGLGDWEGLPGTDQDVVDHPVFTGWMHRERLNDRFQCGESALDLQHRLQAVLVRVLDRDRDGSTVLVTHGGMMAVAVPLVAATRGPARLPANAEIWELTHDGGRWELAGDGVPGPWRPPDTVSGG